MNRRLSWWLILAFGRLPVAAGGREGAVGLDAGGTEGRRRRPNVAGVAAAGLPMLAAGPDRRGVVIMGSSGAGKTTLVAGLLRHREYPAAVLNDDWGAVSLRGGDSVSTGERMLHMKAGSVLALRPGFFTGAAAGSYLRDLSERDRAARPRPVSGCR